MPGDVELSKIRMYLVRDAVIKVSREQGVEDTLEKTFFFGEDHLSSSFW